MEELAGLWYGVRKMKEEGGKRIWLVGRLADNEREKAEEGRSGGDWRDGHRWRAQEGGDDEEINLEDG